MIISNNFSAGKVWVRAIAISTVCLLALNNFSFAAQATFTHNYKYTLSPTSRFNPIVKIAQRDDGSFTIVEDTAQLTEEIAQEAGFLYLGLLAKRVLEEYDGITVTAEVLRNLIKQDLAHIDFGGFDLDGLTREGNTFFIPFIDERGQRLVYAFFLPDEEPAPFPAPGKYSNPISKPCDVGKDRIDCHYARDISWGVDQERERPPEIGAFEKMRRRFKWVSLMSVGGVQYFNRDNSESYSVRDVATDSGKQFEVIKHNQAKFGFDMATTIMDLSCMQEAVSIANREVGALEIRTDFKEKDMDQRGFIFGEGFEFTMENIKKLRLPEIGEHGRMHVFTETMAKMRDEFGDRVIKAGYVTAPFTLAARLLGENEAGYQMVVAPEEFKALMEYCIQVSLLQMQLLIDAGADAIIILDPSTALLDPFLYGEHIVEPVNKLTAAGRERGVLTVFHGCSDSSNFLEQMKQLDVDAFSIDERVDMEKAYQALVVERGAYLIGNVNASDMNLRTPEELEQETFDIMERFGPREKFVCGLTCEMPYDVSEEQIAGIERGIRAHKTKREAKDLLDAVMEQAIRADERGEKVIVGVDTSWIPGLQESAMQGLLARLSTLSRAKGLDNIIIKREKGEALADALLEEVRETETSLANVVILGAQQVLDASAFDPLRSPETGEGAFFAGVVLPEGFPENGYTRFLEMLTIAIRLAFDSTVDKDNPFVEIVEDGQRRFRFIPKAEPVEWEELEKIYDRQKQTLIAA